MNYIELINSFERWLEVNYLPVSSQLLWYKLIALFNRCGWSEWVTVDNQRLMALMQMKRESTFIECRDKLIVSGLFEFQKGKKGSPNRYKIKNTFKIVVQTEVQSVVNTVVKSEVNTEVQTADINKLNKTKLNILSKDNIGSTPIKGVLDAWNNLGLTQIKIIRLASNRHKLLKALLKDYGESEIIRAIGNVKDSLFLNGQNDRGWVISFDWFLEHDNFIKVLEGNYKNKFDSDKPKTKNKQNLQGSYKSVNNEDLETMLINKRVKARSEDSI